VSCGRALLAKSQDADELRKQFDAWACQLKDSAQDGDVTSPRSDEQMYLYATDDSLTHQDQPDCACKCGSANLLQAAERGCLECCKKYIGEAGRRDPDNYNYTALMYAADGGYAQCVALLLD